MIDIETQVFDAAYPYIEYMVPKGSFTSEFVRKPARFPHVYLCEIDNYPDRRTADSGTPEWSSIVAYESQIFAKSKEQCRRIQAKLDEAMVELLGFSKIQGQFVPNLPDQNIYRIVARYRRGVTRTGDMYVPR